MSPISATSMSTQYIKGKPTKSADECTHHRRPQHCTSDTSDQSEFPLVLHDTGKRVDGGSVVVLRSDRESRRVGLHPCFDQEKRVAEGCYMCDLHS